MKKIFYVGRVLDENIGTWEFQGIFENKEDADNAVIESQCKDCFVSSITLNTMLPIEAVSREDCGDFAYYPCFETSREERS